MTLRPLLAYIVVALLAGPAAAQEREWTLDASEQDAYLIFGVPESDDVGISLWCQIGSAKVNVFVPEMGEPAGDKKNVPVTITAGEETAQFDGKVEVNAEAGVQSVEATMAADHPLLSAMEKADRFKVTMHGAETVFPLYNSDLPGLLELCRAK
jgi:hypothetical protein